jgi:hypothetical protein
MCMSGDEEKPRNGDCGKELRTMSCIVKTVKPIPVVTDCIQLLVLPAPFLALMVLSWWDYAHPRPCHYQ